MTTATHRRSGFTLAELMVSMTIMTILMGAMTSVILVASHAIPDSNDPLLKKMAAMDVVDQLSGELFYAISISEATTNAVTFTVADRGHGAAGPETIRYAWSGAAGDPLTRQYNSGTVVTLSETVQNFTLAYSKAVTDFVGSPSVLLIVNDDLAPTAQEMAKRQMMESWGFTVQSVSDHRTLAEQEAVLQNADVVYLVQDALTAPALLGVNPAVGIVCEEGSLFSVVGFSSKFAWNAADSIDILDNTHEITQPFPLGMLRIFSTVDDAVFGSQVLAPGGQILAKHGFFADSTLIAIDVDGVLYGGGIAPARRVSLPWGDRAFDFNNVIKDGLTLMRRAIVWAAAPVVYSSVRIVVHGSGALVSAVETETQILNMPKVNAP